MHRVDFDLIETFSKVYGRKVFWLNSTNILDKVVNLWKYKMVLWGNLIDLCGEAHADVLSSIMSSSSSSLMISSTCSFMYFGCT